MSGNEKPSADESENDSKRSSWIDWITADATSVEMLIWLISLPFRVIAWMVGALLEVLSSMS